ncbi:MAG TPA: hydroxymethylbilane synthase [Polyangiaceae bacterium]|nr:hydroxymethylbilane synthase [Polyangiaceae bacterium]
MTPVRVATRKSALALAQTRAFMAELVKVHPGLRVEEVPLTTTGDRIQDRALAAIGGKGLFVKEIEEALLEGRADLAVHSLKDVPPELPPGLLIGCFPLREDARDALVSGDGRGLAELPTGARVGTSSLRRKVQLEAVRPDLEVVALRGNVDTRLAKCASGEVSAIVLARAGLTRLGLLARVTETLAPDVMIPAVAQGALGIEHRAGDERIAALLAPLSHEETKISVTSERGVLREVQGSCQVPVAAYARRDGSEMVLSGLLAEADGSNVRHAEVRAEWPRDDAAAEALGRELGRRLRAGGPGSPG